MQRKQAWQLILLRRTATILVACAVLGFAPQFISAQEPTEIEEVTPISPDDPVFSEDVAGYVPLMAGGPILRFHHTNGSGISNQYPFTTIGAFQPLWGDSSMFFLDAQLSIYSQSAGGDSDGTVGANGGFGYRIFVVSLRFALLRLYANKTNLRRTLP